VQHVEKPALTTDALIDGLSRQLLDDLANLDALSIDQKRALLKERLSEQPSLIVIDNLETLADLRNLLETARKLANPSKFLFTSRESRFYEPELFHYTVTELGLEDALRLVRAEAVLGNLPSVSDASDAELSPIYDTVGGNPLALRLIVGRLHVHSLERVLDDIQNARGQHATQIYTYVYYQIWQELDEIARRVLLLMPLATEKGADLEYLAAMGQHGGLTSSDVADGLGRLVARNLVDSQGDLHTRRFTIHALTRTFLQQQVLHWQGGDA
jgi:hypothetical protein